MPPPPSPYGYPAQAPQTPYGYVALPPPRRNGWIWAVVAIAIVGVVFIIVAAIFASAFKSLSHEGENNSISSGFGGGDAVAVVEINGVILDADKIDKQLEKFAKQDNVKAILLRINSPGGGAAASQEVYHDVMRVRRESHKPIVASVESVGASGAYYIASACDKIYANQASVVGSIGVIMQWTNYGDLLRWAKMKNITISKGELKDAGDPTRELTPKEEAYFQGLVDNMYAQFVHDVAIGRHSTDARIQPLATGQVWTGEQALPLGLIDSEGGYHEALLATGKLAGISGEPKVVKTPRDKHGLVGLLSGDDDAESLIPTPSQLLNRAPGFYFLWK
ncbi:signal peptide peptidase SppA [Granulicella cerasi]|uniref:Signal peptide peptidase SppA n=1 Tax=Granulicella cerasi TaxID=741063 RepID=A0ABW1ZC71_9BACT|nr:signal peptide peptidase SppA [Granulicella cerasi]